MILFSLLAQVGSGATKTLITNQLKDAGETGADFAASQRTNPLGIVTNIIQVLMSLLGIIFLTLVIYGGWKWMMARGNDKEIEDAKKTISAGVIGLAIVLSGYIISVNVMRYLLTASGQPANFY